MDHWAAKYIGRPWIPGGRGPAAFDCWGLLVWVYWEEFGKAVPSYIGHHAEDPHENLALFIHEEGSGRWRELDTGEAIEEGDAVAISAGSRFHHVGIYLEADGGLILHALQGKGVIAQTRGGLRTMGLQNLKFYRLEP
jgi:cell wall-associated NlpC family hydrolase